MMEPKTLYINYEKSLEIYNKNKRDLKLKQCYNNTFRLVTMYYEKFKSGEWKVAYGYLRIFQDKRLYCRHAFIVDSDNQVIDATLFTKDKDYQHDPKDANKAEYLCMKIFDNLREYVKMIDDSKGYPDLCFPLMELEKEMQQWARENDYFLCG